MRKCSQGVTQFLFEGPGRELLALDSIMMAAVADVGARQPSHPSPEFAIQTRAQHQVTMIGIRRKPSSSRIGGPVDEAAI
jgi:hypothetical protein